MSEKSTSEAEIETGSSVEGEPLSQEHSDDNIFEQLEEDDYGSFEEFEQLGTVDYNQSPKPLSAYKPGEEIDGKIIEYVLCSNNDLIVYKHSSGIAWRIMTAPSDGQDHAQVMYKTYMCRVRSLPLRSDRKLIEGSLEGAFSEAFFNPERTKEQVDSIFKEVVESINLASQKNVKVVSQGNNYQLYLNETGSIAFNTFNGFPKSPSIYSYLHKARQLQTHSKHSLSEADYSYTLDQILCTLSHCIRIDLAGESVDIVDAYQHVEQLILNRLEANLRVKFIQFCVCFTVGLGIVFLILFYAFPTHKIYYQCMSCALAGSFVSILQRHNKMTISHLMSHIGLSTEAFSRICIGVIFGLFTMILSESELALAAFKNNYSAIFLVTFLAGFSERFAPDMFENVIKSQPKKVKS
ncbi:TPA: hypothetical protein ACN310_002223 [Vibrio parahaemolyticus]|uniref:hypothetical protein n=1 Tax=Vibrio parahaemolyticus TaxID=670 RepID=UPI00084BBCCF|nr:hypothetical protein [Vibrio parahaemolyticus]EHW0654481.1 hypothetical protein [Vibrio parahaemolyticus]EJE4699309.1 hypothetical protein [Vibrio parahaemolyticus]ODX33458.1 hypothetical protein BBM03_14645 [Vibrio parahaemolyticus]OMP50141.1 hypothetical protein BBM19_10750 [Vibrio parahaemolyticus]TXM35411.1 hypothetical protein FVP00_13180 [Vibrio parahaemolyticus]